MQSKNVLETASGIFDSLRIITAPTMISEAKSHYDASTSLMLTDNLGQFITTDRLCNDVYCELQEFCKLLAQKCLPVEWAKDYFERARVGTSFIDTRSSYQPLSNSVVRVPAIRNDSKNVLAITKSFTKSIKALSKAMGLVVDKANERFSRLQEDK